MVTVLLSFFDDSVNRKYIYSIIAFSAIFGFMFAGPYLSQFAGYIFIQRNEPKLNTIISEMKNQNISRVYAEDNSEEFKSIKHTLQELEINDVQVSLDGSILFMEGGFMEANGWCYSETGNQPEKYFVNVWLADGENYETITFWQHSHGKWYRWASR